MQIYAGIAPIGSTRFQAGLLTHTDSGYASTSKWLTGRFNTDAYDDLILVFGYQTPTILQAVASTQIATGTGGFTLSTTTSWMGVFSGTQQLWRASDYNGDGRDDLVEVSGTGTLVNGVTTAVLRTHQASSSGFATLSFSNVMEEPFSTGQRWLSGKFHPGTRDDLVNVHGSTW